MNASPAPEDRPPTPQNPYQAPKSSPQEEPAPIYPRRGLGRTATILFLSGTIAVSILLSNIVNPLGLMILGAFPLIAAILIAVGRLMNLGMSTNFVILSIVPVANIWLGWRLIACPPGYHRHQKLDTAGKVLTALFLAPFLVPLVSSLVRMAM